MKRKTLLAIGICLIVLIGIFISFAVHDAGVMNRGDHAESIINNLARFIEEYREDHGAYPASLLELSTDANSKDVLNQILQSVSNFNLKLKYQPRTNGFEIIVTGIDTWRPSLNKIQREYKIGEALK